MVDKPKDIETIYNAARQKTSEAERSAYLDAACANDSALRARVEELLKAQDEIGDFLESPPVAYKVTVDRAPQMEGSGTVIGHYELLELTGEGGMGLVYLAEQKEPVRRRVAFKIIKPGMDSRQVIARFEAERQALAVLDHPNIAKVFDAGTTETGRPYFVMEYVRGMSINRYCDENKLTIEQRLRLFEQVCEAVQHAHQKGIIHRDLKPSNILVSIQGDRAVPKIIDFGIAKAITQPLTDKTFVTLQCHLLGTPEYMSPEQVDLATQDIDTRSDIYSLGVVLYELLAGVLPFENEVFECAGLAEIQQTIREMEPTSPSLRLTGLGEQAKAIAARRGTQVLPLARRLHRELEWIPLKAMRKDRCRRYRSASEMADDVRNYLSGLPLLAGPETTIYRVQKFVRKHAGSVMTVALVVAVIVLGLVVSIWQATVATNARNEALHATAEKDRQAQIAVKERDNALVAQQQALTARERAVTAQQQAEEQRQRAEASEEEARRLLYAANMNLVQHAWEQNNMGLFRQLLEETATYPDRGFEWYYRQRQAHLETRTFHGHSERIGSVAFSPDGRWIVTGSTDGTAKVWEVNSGKKLITLHYAAGASAVAFSPNGQRIITPGWNGTAKIWEAASGKELLSIQGHRPRILSVAFSPDGHRIVTSGIEKIARVWEAESGKELLVLQGHHSPISSVAFSPDGQRIVSGSYDGTVEVWKATDGKELFTLQGHSEQIYSAKFSPDGQNIVTGSLDGTAKVLDANSGRELLCFKGDGSKITSVAFSPDSRRIVAGHGDGMVSIWEVATGKEMLTLQGHSHAVLSAAFSPDGQQVVTGSQDTTTKIWDLAVDKKQLSLRGHSKRLTPIAFSADGRLVATGSADQTTKIWDVVSGEELLTLKGHRGTIYGVAFSPDSRRIITGSQDGSAKIWEVASGKELLSIQGRRPAITSVAFSPDGQRVVTSGGPGMVKVWEAISGKELLALQGHNSPVLSIAFSPNGRQIVTGSGDATAKIWETETGKELLTLKGHRKAIGCVAFSADGRLVATGSVDQTTKIWDAVNGEELLTLKGHGGGIRAVAFSPDGRRIITGSADMTAKSWGAASGKELLTLKGHSNVIRSVAFSLDGQRTITASADETVKIWESASPPQVAIWQEEDATWQHEERTAGERLATLQREGNYFVTQPWDDAEEYNAGNINLRGIDLDLGRMEGEEDSIVGLRFGDIRVPKGVRIKKAYLQFTAEDDSGETKPTDLTIQAELSGYAESFTRADYNISSRKRTKASVKWSPEPWDFAGQRSGKQQTPDLSSLIQEVIDQSDWQEGNALVLIISGSGDRDAISFNTGRQEYAPMLHIEHR
jgi:WD40 repeat protein/serine/threonine protein kinase